MKLLTFGKPAREKLRVLSRVFQFLRLAEKFEMVKWFGPFVKEWLSYSEAKLIEWVRYVLVSYL